MKALTVQEMEKLLHSIDDERLKCMVLVSGLHGCRASEICKLRRADVDLDAGYITIRRLKGSHTTTQPLGATEREMLTNIIAKGSGSPYVFPMPCGQPISRFTFWRQFRAACLKVGIPKDKAHCHTLKHFTCMTLLRNGMELLHLKEFVGHRSIDSTMQYLKVTEEEASAEAAKIFSKMEVFGAIGAK